MNPKSTNIELESLPPFIQVDEIATLMRTKPRTVRDWIASGNLRAIRTTANRGRLLIPRDCLEQFLAAARVELHEASD